MIERMVLDTDTVIHLLRHSPLTVQPFIQLYHNGTIFLVSPIVIAEVYAGALVKEYESIDDFFPIMRICAADPHHCKTGWTLCKAVS